jgi:hypothetical protein
VVCVQQGSSVSSHCGGHAGCTCLWRSGVLQPCCNSGLHNDCYRHCYYYFWTMSCLIALVVDDTTFDMVLRGVFWPHAAVLPQSDFFQVLSVPHAAAMLAPYIVWGMCFGFAPHNYGHSMQHVMVTTQPWRSSASVNDRGLPRCAIGSVTHGAHVLKALRSSDQTLRP